ncbi:MAG: hypothetical protein CMN56_08765 [Sneathiella sp.]|uniref:divergent polysaccharide deacetylase family protein n=1 Tax=Sneathiella sp. TaxID=1964365 RepID=UPI000C65C4D6|nr:divergent polysaccharide deacetylase family protein [Sneathiella sp.]MAZ03217.1 hypothetical protein [Sneathiella sp.]
MRNSINDQKTKPTPKNKVSVLFIASLAVILAIIGIISWSYFSTPAQPKAPIATASTEINETIEIPATPVEVTEDSEPPEPQVESIETTESEVAKEEALSPEIETKAEAIPETTPPEPEPVEAPTPTIAAESHASDDPTTSPTTLLLEPPVDQEELEITPSLPTDNPPAEQSTQEEETTVFTPLPEDIAWPELPDEAPEETTPAEEVQTSEDGADTTVPSESEVTPDVAPLSAMPEEQLPQTAEPETQVNTPVEETIVEEPKIPMEEFAVVFDTSDERPLIAIILSDAGFSASRTREAIKVLPAPITFAFNPYGSNLQEFVDQARSKGHEILLQLPMEPKGYPRIDPGPQALRTDLEDAENLERLDWVLGRITGYVGLTNQMGSKFTSEPASITPILQAMKEKGLLYLDSRTASDSVAADIAAQLDIPVAINNRFLDHKADGNVIDKRLEDLENIARRAGFSVGIAYPHTETFQHIIDWASTLDKKGLTLAPITAIVKKQDIE